MSAQGMQQGPGEATTSHQSRHRGRGRAGQPVACQHSRQVRRDVRAWEKNHQFSLWREERPIPKDWAPTVVPGARTTATPLLSLDKAVERLSLMVHDVAAEHFAAFYSSEMGGIVTDPALMVISMDDHMVHRGHGVFDTVLVTDGHTYQLAEHLARFRASAQAAGVPVLQSDEALMRIILDTAAASRKLNCIIKFWASVGRGGFGLSTNECIEPTFYALASSEVVPKRKALDKLHGFRACTSPYLPTDATFATIKSTNYLRNAIALMAAESQGVEVALFIDANGHVQEGPNMNLGIITQAGELVTPPFEGCLAGITMQRLIEIIPAEVERSPNDVLIESIAQRPISREDLMGAREAFLTGSTLGVMPLVELDDERIGDGTPGITSLALDAMLVEDMKVLENGASSDRHIQVPFGYLTGMRDQLL